MKMKDKWVKSTPNIHPLYSSIYLVAMLKILPRKFVPRGLFFAQNANLIFRF